MTMYLRVFAGACASSLENWYEQLKYRSKLQAVKNLKLKKLHTTQTLNFLTRHVHVQMQNIYCSNHCIVCLCKTNSDTITYSVTVLNPLCIAGRRLQSLPLQNKQ